MYKRLSFSFILLLIVAFSFACSDDCDESSPTAINYSNFSGNITNADGETVSGVLIVAMERTTNAKFVTHSAADGSYEMEIEDGVYDLGYDVDPYATRFYGPVDVEGDTELNIVLYGSDNTPSHILSGDLRHIDNRSCEGWTVTAYSAVADSLETSSATTTVNASGHFELEIHGEMLLDLDFSNGAELVEFVDIAKLDKGCHVTFSIGSTPNVLRHYQSEETFESTVSSQTNNTLKLFKNNETEISTHHTNVPFLCVGEQGHGGLMEGGKLYVDAGDAKITVDDHFKEMWHYDGPKDMVRIHAKVKKDGSWWYDYGAHFKAYDSGGFASYNGDEYLHIEFEFPEVDKVVFKDLTNDMYSIAVITDGWHKVSYNSHHPTMYLITWGH